MVRIRHGQVMMAVPTPAAARPMVAALSLGLKVICRRSPFGSTVAHGFSTLSLSADLLDDILLGRRRGMILNYGLNRVRYPAPLPVDSRICMHAAWARRWRSRTGI